jgi:hypothetical protein
MTAETSKIITKTYPLAELEFDVVERILFFRMTQSIEVDVPEILEMIKYAKEVVGEIPHFGIVNFGSETSSTAEARKIYAESEYIKKCRLADAFVVQSLAVKLIANFFIRVTRPKVVTKMFNNETESLVWIHSLNK